MTLDDVLMDSKAVTTHSAFTRHALRNSITQTNFKQMEDKHREGYKKKPVNKSEFSIWESEQKWID